MWDNPAGYNLTVFFGNDTDIISMIAQPYPEACLGTFWKKLENRRFLIIPISIDMRCHVPGDSALFFM